MKFTITEALPEVNLLEKRINDRIAGSMFAGVTVGKKGLIGVRSREDFEKDSTSACQSIQDLINRRNLIKSLILASNAVTKVSVGRKNPVQMTVAEAIDRKHSIDFEKTLLHQFESQLVQATNSINKTNREVQVNLDKQLEALAGKEAKANVSEYEGIMNAYKEANEAKLVDPLSLQTKIVAMREAIEDFEQNVDTALSKINTLTEIEISD